jgi:hypothetical protein
MRRRPLTPAQEAAKAARRDHLRNEALRLMAEWPGGLPPLSIAAGITTGILVGLERDGFAQRLADRDRIGDPRWRLTAAGEALQGGADGLGSAP